MSQSRGDDCSRPGRRKSKLNLQFQFIRPTETVSLRVEAFETAGTDLQQKLTERTGKDPLVVIPKEHAVSHFEKRDNHRMS